MPRVTNVFVCPVCGQPTKVLRTRSALAQRLIRYRICAAGHKTVTRETIDGDLSTPRNTVDRSLVRIALQDLLADLGIELTSDS